MDLCRERERERAGERERERERERVGERGLERDTQEVIYEEANSQSVVSNAFWRPRRWVQNGSQPAGLCWH